MKRALLTLAAGALLLLLVAVAAPAMSLERYRPRPVDFELAPAPAARAASGAAVSAQLQAPRRFNLVGLRWRGRARARARATIALRVRRAGGAWSRWTRLPPESDGAPDPRSGEHNAGGVSAPAWAGEADYVQYRLSRPLPGVRLHFVNTTGSATAWSRAETAVRRADNSALLALARVPLARAQDAQPPIQPRSAWGADGCPPRTAPDYGEVKAAFVHHTVTINDYTQDQVPAMILGICRFHRNSNGWNDIGYNFLVDKFGTLWEGRAGGVDQAVVGAQAQGYNSQSTGIANLGTFTSTPQTDSALSAIAALIRWKLPLHGVPTSGSVELTSGGGSDNRYPAGTPVNLQRVSGHRDVDATACPGDSLYAQLDALRAKVGSIAPRRPRTRIAGAVQPATVTYPAAAHMTGGVRLLAGGPLAGVPVEVQLFAAGAWRTISRTGSRGNGSFDVALTPTAKRVLRVRFPGSPAYVASASTQSVVQVRPAIELRRSVARASVGRTPTIAGSIHPAKTHLLIVVERRSGGAARRVATLRVRASHGRFRKSFRLSAPGLYRYRVLFTGDKANFAARSPALYVRAVGGSGGGAIRALGRRAVQREPAAVVAVR